MGNAAIYYYPEETQSLRVIDLGEPLSDMQVTPFRVQDVNTGSDFESSVVDYGGSHRVRFIFERFSGDDQLVADLESFANHAQRGLPFGLVADTADSFGAFTQAYTMSPGKTSITTLGNVFSAWSGVLALTVGDTVVMHSGNPEYKFEHLIVSTWSTTTGKIGLGGQTTKYDMTVGPAFVRHQDFFPVCYLDPGQRGAILTHDHRINYTLDLTAIYSPAGIKALYNENGGQGVLIGEIDSPSSGNTLQGLIRDETATSRYGIRI